LGRKRIREGKYLHCLLTGLSLLLVWGCASIERSRLSGDLQSAAELFARGDFDGSRKANQNIIALSEGKPPADKALFNLGLIYANNKYPRKDYRKSIGFFQRVVREYPHSPLVPQAKTWMGVLEVIEKSKEVDIELELKKKQLVR